MTHVADPQRRTNILTRAARAFGLSELRRDPRRFSALLETTIGENGGYFAPARPPQELSHEERRLLGRRLEDLVDEAVNLAAELYPGRRRDTALLSIAVHTERLMHRIWADPWGRGAHFASSIARPSGHDCFQHLWSSLSAVRSRACCFEES